MAQTFADRAEAGRALAGQLQRMALPGPVVVLALPRGGVPVAAEIARTLQAPLDLLLVRKIGAPGQPELAVAALVEGTPPALVRDEETCAATGVHAAYLEREVAFAAAEIQRRRRRYLAKRAAVPVQGRTVVVVDDGVATGTTMRAALRGLRQRQPAHVVLALPVGPPDTLAALRAEADQVVCLRQPEPFRAIGLHYRDFHQLDDEEVVAALDSAPGGPGAGA
ncbi:MAG: phosphoribosyltransferase [Rubrivivax sp.]|nr:phosphoribosyltransferase [Rubrivivax sp.]